MLQIGRFPAQAGSVIHNFAVNFPGYVIYEGQRRFLQLRIVNVYFPSNSSISSSLNRGIPITGSDFSILR
jgi:hypothetical protein